MSEIYLAIILQNCCLSATRLHCVTNHTHMRLRLCSATTHTVSRFGRLANHSGKTAAPHSADRDIIALLFQVVPCGYCVTVLPVFASHVRQLILAVK